jgi:hypothetical protein
VDVPRWIENDLKHAADTLEASYELAVAAATDLMAYCRVLGAPFGINIESVSIRRVEIEASVRLADQPGGLSAVATARLPSRGIAVPWTRRIASDHAAVLAHIALYNTRKPGGVVV